MATHELKILPEYFEAVERGDKKFECRINDRGYKVGDTLILRRWHSVIQVYSDELECKVTYILDDIQFTQPDYVIMSIEVIK